MARKPHSGKTIYDTKALSSGKLFYARLLKVNADGSVDIKNEQAKFLLNPSAIKESKTTNWTQHNIPGQSDPVMQWVSGGPRTITFEALVTQDTSYHPYDNKSPNPIADLANSAISAVGSIASKFAGVNIPLTDVIGALIPNQDAAGEELSIVNWLNYYRTLLYPTYASNGTLQQSPPLVILDIGRATSRAFTNKKNISPTDTVFVVTNLEIDITKFLPNLTPMEALVSFTLVEYIIQPKDVGSFGVVSESKNSASTSFANTVSNFLGL